MMRLVLGCLVLSIAAPVGAQRSQPMLPLPPLRTDYVESVCTGGIDGRFEQVRVLVTGQVLKVTRRSNGVMRTFATRAEIAKIWRALDVARFDQRVVPPEKPYIMDGVDCSLTRRNNGRLHTVTLMQQVRGKPKYRDLAQALDDVNALGGKATGPILRPAGER